MKEGEVIIVDEFTGRLMPGRRWSDGLHQAVEAKEGVKIEAENQTLATISFQNYFRMYSKLAGMTGTADTEAEEFAKTYNRDVVVVPTNKKNIRKDSEDVVYQTRAREVRRHLRARSRSGNEKGQPVLVGTVSVAKSEVVSSLLKQRGVPHNVLNAKHHAARGRDRRAGGPQGRGHDLDQHGRPRHRHHPRRQRRDDGEARGRAGARRADGGRGAEQAFLAARREWARRLAARRSRGSRTQTAAEHEEVVARRRPPHRRHRAARVAPHRQPAARPRRPPGRPGLLDLLPVPRGRPHAHLRIRADPGAHDDGWG